MRTDCIRDNRKTPLPCASHLGYDLWNAKRGNWIAFSDSSGARHFARVLGGVTTTGGADKGTRYVEAIAILGCFDNPVTRWIRPEEILQCCARPPVEIFEFLCGEWKNPATILARVAYGFSPKHKD